MSLEWFLRMENAVRNSLPDLCETLDNFELFFDTNTTEKHPTFRFSIETGQGMEEFCLIHFDTINQEFFSYHYHEEVDLEAKVLLNDLDDMINFVHDSFYEHISETNVDLEMLDEQGPREDIFMEDEEYKEIEYEGDVDDDDHIDWITNDKHIHIEDHTPNYDAKYMIHLKLGIDKETGDGVLYRNTFVIDGLNEEEEDEEKVYIYFKRDEAPYIIDLINEYLMTVQNGGNQ